MKVLLFAVLMCGSIANANCPFDQGWTDCRSEVDCVWAEDGCGSKRIAANKLHVNKFKGCPATKSDCGNDHGGGPIKVIRCDDYKVKFDPPQPSRKSCVGLGTLADYAINNGDLKKLASVVADSKDVQMSLSHIHETPLTLAALNAKAEIVKWLLSKGAKVNFQTKNGYTALMFAATSRDSDKKAVLETVQSLLSAGADKSLKNSRGETALDQARLVKNAEVVKLLQ